MPWSHAAGSSLSTLISHDATGKGTISVPRRLYTSAESLEKYQYKYPLDAPKLIDGASSSDSFETKSI
ncbi:hypothetical protein FOC1_g10012610 [Fusarium oxysporum f. sp. cubense race 1]|uniref:Uncharacterized protein n=1 Tax=Fusarium oxysporum f. sp. cubense (strain race 1) TaxID=1229664 RepID=N4TSY7_FUSC1|nr:hypothetical protein FOC1_g10012610 [Fusarium oxysporum f. sp. cubense race 1]